CRRGRRPASASLVGQSVAVVEQEYMARKRVFLLSPANCNGKRAQLTLREAADFDLARRLRAEGAPLGELFSFVSGLYFRGKLAYALRFAQPPAGTRGVH